MHVSAVVVSFNRPSFLRKCINSLLTQTRRLDRIIIVDNASEDPVSNVIRDILETNTLIVIIRIPENCGGAGGFYIGLKEAFIKRSDAAWLMDDDVLPTPDALEMMIKTCSKRNLTILNSLVIRQGMPAPDNVGCDKELASYLCSSAGVDEMNMFPVEENKIDAFNGTFITRDVYNIIGDIKFESFIWGDEADYIARAQKKKIRFGTARASIVFHPEGRQNRVRVRPFSQILLVDKGRDKFYFRNAAFLSFQYSGLLGIVKYFLSHICTYMIKGRVNQLLTLILYSVDGMFDLYALPPSRNDTKRALDGALIVSDP